MDQIYRSGTKSLPQGKPLETAGNSRPRGNMLLALPAWGEDSYENGRIFQRAPDLDWRTTA
jgi:hypothetical protein